MLIPKSNQFLLLYLLDCVFTLGNIVRDPIQRGGASSLGLSCDNHFQMAILHSLKKLENKMQALRV